MQVEPSEEDPDSASDDSDESCGEYCGSVLVTREEAGGIQKRPPTKSDAGARGTLPMT